MEEKEGWGGWTWRRRLSRSLSGKLIILDVSVGQSLAFISLAVCKADVDIICRGHRDVGNAHNERVSVVENQIIARLQDRFGTARNANELCRVLSKSR